MPPPPDIDALSPRDLKRLVLELLDERAELRRTIGALRDEIARLKGGPGRPDIKASVKPDIKPSGMEKVSKAAPAGPSGERRRRGPTRTKLTIHDERKLGAHAPMLRPARVSKAMRAFWFRIWPSARSSPTS